jgi:hypothetical protein
MLPAFRRLIRTWYGSILRLTKVRRSDPEFTTEIAERRGRLHVWSVRDASPIGARWTKQASTMRVDGGTYVVICCSGTPTRPKSILGYRV